MDQHAWDAILEFVQDRKIRVHGMELYHEWARRFTAEHLVPVIELMADGRFEEASDSIKNRLAGSIGEAYRKDLDWRHAIHPLVVGAALEWAGYFIETLPYYEHIIQSSLLTDELRNIAMARWLRTKELQGEWERVRGQRLRAEEILREVRSKSAESGIAVPQDGPSAMLADLPAVDAPQVATAQRMERRITGAVRIAPVERPVQRKSTYSQKKKVGNLFVRVSPDGQRVNIEHSETLEQASYRLVENLLVFEGSPYPPSADGHLRLEEWGLVLDLRHLRAGKIGVTSSSGVQAVFAVRVEAT